ncbi:MAG: cell division protein ZapD [Methylococcales bacterium]|nr:cell division protein ZapD [Methylococcales bacterium]
MSKHIYYEFPLNERIRMFMRLEQLFQQLDHFMEGESVYDKRAAISALLDIINIFSRNDIKSEVLKELDRQAKTLNILASNDGIDSKKLSVILNNIQGISKRLYQANGKIGINLMESELFKSISQRSAIPGGMCSFDLPEFHYWLKQDVQTQQEDLDQWTQPFLNTKKAIQLTLNFIRHSNQPTEEEAEAGFFQLALDQSKPFQLLRIAIQPSYPCFAETSGGKHRFTIRFMNKSVGKQRPTQVVETIPFLLTRCAF